MIDDELKRLFDSMRQENAEAHSETRRLFEVKTEETRRRAISRRTSRVADALMTPFAQVGPTPFTTLVDFTSGDGLLKGARVARGRRHRGTSSGKLHRGRPSRLT